MWSALTGYVNTELLPVLGLELPLGNVVTQRTGGGEELESCQAVHLASGDTRQYGVSVVGGQGRILGPLLCYLTLPQEAGHPVWVRHSGGHSDPGSE